MPEIILLCSVHKENGKCNSNELVRILELIEPEVLFQEVPYFEYLEKNILGNGSILEINAISKYLESHDLLQVPVDTFGGSSSENKKYAQVIERVLRTGPDLSRLLDLQICWTSIDGFEFLNSLLGDSMHRQIDLIVMQALAKLNDPKLSIKYEEWKNYNSKRDVEMIRKIYEYCRTMNFKRGLFLFGSGHRRSLISNIQIVKKIEKVRVIWKLGWESKMRKEYCE